MKIFRLLTAGLMVALAAGGAVAQKRYDPGATDTAIKIGQTVPLSGPASSWGSVAKAAEAYFRMVNDNGGINGRKIELIVYDDAYEPAKTVEMTRKAVEADKVLFMSGSLGTGQQVAVAPYMNRQKVPQLFLASPSAKLADAKTYPYTMMSGPAYQTEGASWLKHLASLNPTAKVAVIYQDDEAGRSILEGFSANLEQTQVKIVSKQTYQVTDPSIDSQIITMKGAGADTVLLITINKMTALALRKMTSLDWRPAVYVSQGGSSVKSALEPAGLENSKDVITVFARMSLGDPSFANDPSMKEYLAFVAKYLPGTNAATDDAYALGYMNAALTAQVIRQAGDNLTRENIMKVAASFKDYRAPLLLPGVTLNSTSTDYRLFKQLQLHKFDGKSYVPFGPIISVN